MCYLVEARESAWIHNPCMQLHALILACGLFIATSKEVAITYNNYLDFCPEQNITLPYLGDSSLDVRILWPLTPLGDTVTISCPCGNLVLNSSALVATRECRGDFDSGAVWHPPQDSPCDFSMTARMMCALAEVSQKNHTLTQVLGYLSVLQFFIAIRNLIHVKSL